MNYFIKRHNKAPLRVTTVDTPYPESDPEYDLCKCFYSGALFIKSEGIVLGAIIPQVNSAFLCHPLAKENRLRSLKMFQDNEQNCNTCKHLKREPFDKKSFSVSGLMPGECTHNKPEPLYPRGGGKIMFAPDDCMLQPCFESRD